MTPHRLPEPAVWAAWKEPEPDAYETTDARAMLGRFACAECANNRDDADRLERELEDARAALDRARALLRFIGKAEQRPAAAAHGYAETPYELALIGFARTLAEIKARIEVYFQSLKQ
jgi:hypothetical protein